MKNNQAELVKQMSPKELLFHLYLSQLVFLVLGIIAAFFLFDDYRAFIGILQWHVWDIFVLGTALAFTVVLLDIMVMKFASKELFDDGGINEKMFQTRTIPHILWLAFIISVSEELLFRGVIQTHAGIWIASVLFAILHIRYLNKWFLFLSVLVVSFLLGVIYEWTNNLLVTIWAHFLIDALLAVKIRIDYLRKQNGIYNRPSIQEERDENRSGQNEQ
ncbi:CAAX amino terminal protease self- immunity [Bacillus sp. THAF10]|uniref:CPBP family intramembrane glutamic endopeptidase n=1 Tax=Bacillus sp. THAF10 TaxID=2587848 RepID=UPI0012A98031|nr:type II CAAX endopeptidase family protein [Bacillus sp. THAF10]QFT89437.1 CAAX amino terminal protease self- immunity [Bacillus sp. THAF10]